MRNVLVTGANGFIGQHLCRSLLDQGYNVRGLKYEEKPLYFIDENEVEFIDGNLLEKNSLENIMDDIDTVFHLAAISRNDLRKTWNDFYDVNVRGTKFLLDLANSAEVSKFVFVSTVEAAGYNRDCTARKESDTPAPENNYGRSKLEAENVVLNNNSSMQVVVCRLPMTYGPGTKLIVPKLFGMVKKGFYPFIGKGSTQMEFCYVGNVVHALSLLGTDKKLNKEIFYVSDERPYSIKEVINAIASSQKRKYMPIHIPVFFATLVAIGFEFFAKIFPFPPIVSRFSKKPFITRETVWWTTHNVNTVSTEKIRREIGYTPIFDINHGCKTTSNWLASVE